MTRGEKQSKVYYSFGKIMDCRERWGVRFPIAVTLSNCVVLFFYFFGPRQKMRLCGKRNVTTRSFDRFEVMGQIDYGILVSYQHRAPQGLLAVWYQQVRLPKIFTASHLHGTTVGRSMSYRTYVRIYSFEFIASTPTKNYVKPLLLWRMYKQHHQSHCAHLKLQ